MSGLFFIDGHEDTMPLDVSEDGEAANAEIGLLLGLTGRLLTGPLGDRLPALRPEQLVMLGPRDDGVAPAIQRRDLGRLRCLAGAAGRSRRRSGRHRAPGDRAPRPGGGPLVAAHRPRRAGSRRVSAQGLPDFEDEPGGLTWRQLTDLVRAILETGACVGFSIAIYDPDQDPDRRDATNIVDFVRNALAAYREEQVAPMAEPIDEYFTTTVSAMTARASADGSSLTVPNCLALFDAQLGSRHLDLAARWLRSNGKGYYTIGSSGHEGNVAVAAALRPTDPALLHYRSGGFFLARAQQVTGSDPLRDVLLGLVAATEEPISGGRHKVFGRRDLNIIPQTSTIASHLPRAVGVAFSIARTRKLGVACPWPDDAVTVCSFGDASANHSTAIGAINAAMHSAYQGLPMPLLFVCEDNGIGISTKTPRGWIARTYGQREGLEYFDADGSESAGCLRRRGGRSLVGPHPPASGLPASAHGPADGTRRFRLRTGISTTRRDRRRVRPRSGAVHRETVDHPRSSHPGRGARPLRGQTC